VQFKSPVKDANHAKQRTTNTGCVMPIDGVPGACAFPLMQKQQKQQDPHTCHGKISEGYNMTAGGVT
jgi:hypothetical protein